PRVIREAIKKLEANLDKVAQVSEWAKLIGYQDVNKFSRHFLWHFKKKPGKILKVIRQKSIIKDLRNRNASNLEVALNHSLRDENALYGFIKYYFGCSPTEIKDMTDKELRQLMNKIID
ncbi:MAG: hypothetical protein WD491_08970, partial [Balneolales bacterium]